MRSCASRCNLNRGEAIDGLPVAHLAACCQVLFAEDVVGVCATDVRDAVAAMKRAVEKIPANASRATPEVGTVQLGDYLYRKCASLADFTPQTQAGTAIKSVRPCALRRRRVDCTQGALRQWLGR